MVRPPVDAAFRHAVEEIFEEALEIPRAERRGWLASRCGDDRALRAEVDALIAAHERAEGILERDGAAAVAGALPDPNRDRRIGAYRVLRELGRGGMGVVYLAERDDGLYQQHVAVKLLRASPDAEELHRRFKAERQILASLRHAGIAQLLDGGVADGQLPFIVMEYVDGSPITTHCDRRRLGIEARLRLFRDVCAAVHYAHRNLIIHRDLKPGNILVSGEGAVKLLDFGVAKLLNPALGPFHQPHTRTEFRAMTPEYASPEQVRGETLTTTSDVYALGVVLYELLCGRRPYYLTRGSPQEMFKYVCEQTPDRPSVATTRPAPPASDHPAATPESVAQARGVSPERLRHLLSGDLDAIVMMALRKEPGDRYGSADLLWEDLQRYLDGLPVLAHRGSRLYRARRFLGRHRVESAATAAVVLSLAIGTGVAIRQAAVAASERDRAEHALTESEQSLKQSENVTGFLVGLFDATTPTVGGGVVTAADLLRRGTAQLEAMHGRPLEQARMLEAMGRIHMTMARYPEALSTLERSLALRRTWLGTDHIEVSSTLFHLSEVLRRMGEYRRADFMARSALAIRTAKWGPRHPAVAEVLAQRAILAVYLSDLPGAEAMSKEALSIRREVGDPTDPLIGAALELHASHLRRTGRNTEAASELREAIALYQMSGGMQSYQAAYLQLRLAELMVEVQGDTAGAEALMRSALGTTRASLGEDRPRTAWAMGDLSNLLSFRGKHEEAIALRRRGLEINRRSFGERHPNVADYAVGLAEAYGRAGRLAEADSVLRDAMDIFEHTLGANHTAYAGTLASWADIQLLEGKYDVAIAARRRVLEIRRRTLGDGNGMYGIDASRLARMYARKGDYAKADSLFAASLESLSQFMPETNPDVRDVYAMMAERYRLAGDRPAAERYAKKALPP